MKGIDERFGYYREYIERLNDVRLEETPIAKDLKIPSRVQQAAYREMRELGFKAGLIDYLSWTFGMYILSTWSRWLNNQPGGMDETKSQQGFHSLFGLFGFSEMVFFRALNVLRAVDINEYAFKDTGRDYRLLMLDKIKALSVYRPVDGAIKVAEEIQDDTPDAGASSTSSQSTNQPTEQTPAPILAQDK